MSGDDLRMHPDDEALLERLHAVAEVVDPVPDDVLVLGRAAFDLHRADAILMELASEALSGAELRAAVDQGSSRLNVFEHGSVSIEVEVTRRGDFARAIGIVDDADDPELAGAHLTLETKTSSTTVDLDGGRFAFERVPLGLARLVLEREGERVLTTTWFEVA